MSTNVAFEEAYHRFLDTLSPDERHRFSPCASADDFLDGLQKIDVLAKRGQKKRAARIISSVTALSERLKPYFDVIGIMIQSNPQYTAIIWGALRFILEAASTFTTFFEKLIDRLEALSEAFPSYEGVVALCAQTRSPRLKSHLEKVYTDLFGFFQSVAHVFTSRNGQLRKTPVVIGEIFWKPFDARFTHILGQMHRHTKLLKFEVSLLGAQVVSDLTLEETQRAKIMAMEREDNDKARKVASEAAKHTRETRRLIESRYEDEKFQQIIGWLRPPLYGETHDESQRVREDGTNSWLFGNPTFRQWRETPWSRNPASNAKKMGANCLWVYGNPGSGKTIQASSTIEELKLDFNAGNGKHDVFYFFFKQEKPSESSSPAAYRSVLAQIISCYRQEQSFIDKFDFIMNSMNSTGGIGPTSATLADLLRLFVADLDCYLVLDGIDECSDKPSLIRDLLWITSHSSAKILLFGRLNVPLLNRSIQNPHRIAFDRSATSEDIRVYLTTKVEGLIEDDLLAPVAPVPDLVERLVKGADGMFLWARLMITFLNSPALTPGKRLKTIREVILPEGLEVMYNRIVRLIAEYSKTEKDLASWITTWLLHSVRPLTLKQLQEAISLLDDRAAESEDHHRDFQETLSYVCAGLVECVDDSFGGGEPYARFIHLSVKEHFTLVSNTSKGVNMLQGIVLPDCVANVRLGTVCFRKILAESPDHAPSGNGHWGRVFRKEFLVYATTSWIKHLNRAAFPRHPMQASTLLEYEEDILQMVLSASAFLDSPLAVSTWIEAYYSCPRQIDDQHPAFDCLRFRTGLNDWASYLPVSSELAKALRSLASVLDCFVHDMKDLVASWGGKLCSNPCFIWDEAAAFTKSRFLQQGTATEVKFLDSKRSKGDTCSNKYLCKTSASTPDGQLTGVLSIWTSESFERDWVKNKLDHARSAALNRCEGWSARYEVWDTAEMCLKADIRIPLDKDEVSLQMRQSFRQEDLDKWATSFPTAISMDCHSFIILRTLVELRPATDNSAASCRTAKIPMDWTERLQFSWSDDLKPFSSSETPSLIRAQYLHDWYTYSMNFSACGQYILFSDCNRSPVTNAAGVNVGVFAIHDLEGRLSVELIGLRQLRTLLALNVDHTLFHPSGQLVIVCFGGNIAVWRFKEALSDFIYIRRESLEDFSWTGTTSGQRKAVISSCGRYVVLIVPRKESPIIVSIPEEMLNTRDEHAPNIAVKEEPQELTTTLPASGLPVSAFGLCPGQMLQSIQVHCQEDGQLSHLISLNADSTVRLTISHRAGSSASEQQQEQSFNLVTLPQWKGTENAVPVLTVPAADEASVRIILNTPAEKAYSMARPRGTTVPLVIERDLAGVRHTVLAEGPSVRAAAIAGAAAMPCTDDWSTAPNRHRIMLD